MTPIFETASNDNGSLFTGSHRPSIGDSIHIVGEPNPRVATYVMGSDAKGWRACFKGQGAVPEGRVRWAVSPLATRAQAPGPSLAALRPKPLKPSPTSSPPAEGWPAPLTLPRGRRPSFDAYVMVDWSASATPKRGPDSIWWVASRWSDGRLHFDEAVNPDTRSLAKEQLTKLLHEFVGEGLSVLVGFDFPYGYPTGFASLMGVSSSPPWRTTWDRIAERITDNQGDRGTNNRFEVAAQFNRTIGGRGPFWGHPPTAQYPGLTSTKPPLPWPVPEFRLAERRTRGPKSPFQLNGAGSVGGQVLMGVPVLAALRDDPVLRSVSSVWPFETGASLPERQESARIVHAEIYPSLVKHPVPEGWVKDQAQVVALTHHLATLDASDELRHMFAVPATLPEADRRKVLEEEGWILGVG